MEYDIPVVDGDRAIGYLLASTFDEHRLPDPAGLSSYCAPIDAKIIQIRHQLPEWQHQRTHSKGRSTWRWWAIKSTLKALLPLLEEKPIRHFLDKALEHLRRAKVRRSG